MTIKERVAILWEELNKFGIYTEEELDKALKETPLNIGIFVSPIDHIFEGEEKSCGKQEERS